MSAHARTAPRIRVFSALAAAAWVLMSAPLWAEESPISSRDKLYDITVVPPGTLWVVGYPGKVLRSADRGDTWERISLGDGDEALFSITYPDPGHGWISGRGGIIFHTADGGKTWTRQESGVEEPLFDLSFVDSSRGWAVGHFGTIIRTRDGGRTWERQYLKKDFTGDLGGRQDAFIIDESGSVFLQDAGVEREEIPHEKEIDPSLNGVFFRNDRLGWVVGEFGIVYRTRDGGETWEPLDSGVETSLFAVRFADDSNGWAVGPKGVVLKTADGGNHWESFRVGGEENLFEIGLKGGDVWLIGDHGMVVRSLAGTEEFFPVESGAFSWLSGITFVDKRAIIVGGKGSVLYLPGEKKE